MRREPTSLLVRTELAEGEQVLLEPTQFTPVELDPTLLRGAPEPAPYTVAARNRLSLNFGYWDSPSLPQGTVVSGAANDGLSVGFEYARFMREGLAVSFGVRTLPIDAGTSVGPEGAFSGSRTIVSIPIGLRWNPSRSETSDRAIKPYVLGGVGPVIGAQAGSGVTSTGVLAGAQNEVTLGGHVGGGVDFHLGRSWALGLEAGYNWMLDLNNPIGGNDNFSGFELRVGLAWLFGKGSAPRD